MPLKMTMMFKKYIITLPISNYTLKKSVIMADFFNLLCLLYKEYIWSDKLIIKIDKKLPITS